MIRIVIAEDHRIVREGVQALIDREHGWEVVAAASTGLDALKAIEQEKPDVVVVDLGLPELSGLEVIRRLPSQIKTVVLSMHDGEQYVVEALRNGARGYVLKDEGGEQLVRAIRTVLDGRIFLSSSLPAGLIERARETTPEHLRDRYDTLTDRQREILSLVAEGYTSPEIGEKLFISVRTVDTHRAHIMAKLGLQGQTDLVHYAIRRGLVTARTRS